MLDTKKTYTRRRMLSLSALLGGAAIASGAGLAALTDNAFASAKGQSPAESVNWDKTVDIVVAGSGCGTYAAIIAAHEGASVCVLEKGSLIGGTTSVSGNMCWVPNNIHMKDAGVEELPKEDIVNYLRLADVYNNANVDLLEHFVDHAPDAFAYIEEEIGFKMGVRMSLPLRGDYYNVAGYLPKGRSMDFLKDGEPIGSKTFAEIVLPKAQELGIEIVDQTAITDLITDADGSVVGVVATKGSTETFVKAEKGVILATGGFDWNPEMVKAFQRGPMYISVGVQTNTGDGQLLGAAVGAGLGNMQNCWGVQAIITADEGFSSASDWGNIRSLPNSLLVNRHGRRFTNEGANYAACNPSFYSYDTSTCDYLNLPAYLIFDQTFVDYYGFPGAKAAEGEKPQQPEYVQVFNTLEELATACEINTDGLLNEVERFNGFAVAGVDPDWHRGEFPFDTLSNGDRAGKQSGLANSCMGPVEKAPFYCLKMGPGCCGTSGGVLVNENAQAVSAATGEPISGLYALGNCAAAIFGSAYPGSGATVGSGVFQGLMAVQHALGYAKY